MEKAKIYLKEYEEPLMTGVFAVVLGFAGRKILKMDNISTGGVKLAAGSFVMVTLAAVASQELENRALTSPT